MRLTPLPIDFIVPDSNPNLHTSYICNVESAPGGLGIFVDFVGTGFQRHDGEAPIQIQVINGIPVVRIWDNINSVAPQVINLNNAYISKLNKKPNMPPQEDLAALIKRATPLIQGKLYKHSIKEANTELTFVLFLNTSSGNTDYEDVSLMCRPAHSATMDLCQLALDKFIESHPDDICDYINNTPEFAEFETAVSVLCEEGESLDGVYDDFNFRDFLRTLD